MYSNTPRFHAGIFVFVAAIAIGAERVQLCRPCFNKEMVDKAHAHGIKCNVFWADEPEKTKEYPDLGIDCILTNDYLQISNFVKEYLKK